MATTSEPKPVDILNDYATNPQARLLADRVVQTCPKPTFIPVLNKHVINGHSANVDMMATSPKAFILVHAIQLLLFAPQDWDKDRPYSRETDSYPHRFPTPAEVGGDTEKHVADSFSMEDLHRAILLFCQLIYRRLGRTAWTGRASSQKKVGGLRRCPRLAEAANLEESMLTERGICSRKRERARELRELAREEGRLPDPGAVLPPDPDDPIPLADLDTIDASTKLLEMVQPARIVKIKVPQQAKEMAIEEMEPISAESFRAEIRLLKQHHDQPDFDAILERTRKTITNVDKFVRDNDVNAFMEKQRQSGVVSDFARQHPEQEEDIMKLSRYQYQLEHTLASIQPVQDRPLNDICDEFGITPWPELKLYSDDDGSQTPTIVRLPFVQPLKAHQVDDATTIVTRGMANPPSTTVDTPTIKKLENGYRHTFLSNDMGTGKTKTYLTAIELNNRHKSKARQQDINT
ncbi:hypothetical protein NW768_011354 [Fusarium equiseti]|uniref:SNF2 N-terminal domain-containing protein n=1 Tax=Fusarium equiseti TaxID=61235 RepID=A0ABQ8QY14_FUSEQ|nr:hypothetical protein NW768_011354 [Fusarium equiseti]